MFEKHHIQQLRTDLAPFSLDAPCPLNGALPQPLETYLEYYGFYQTAKHTSLEYFIGMREVSLGSATYQVATHFWQIAECRGTVLVMHGLFDHIGLFQKFIGHLLAQGYCVIAVDLPGHGLSSGDPTAIGSFDDYEGVLRDTILFFQQALGGIEHFSAIGQSTGAAVLMRYMFHCKQNQIDPFLERLVFMGPLVRPKGWGVGKWAYKCFGGILKTIRRDMNRANSHDREFHNFLAHHDPLQSKRLSTTWVGALAAWIEEYDQQPVVDTPLLIVQGTDDHVVDWEYNTVVIQQHFPASQLNLIEGAKHHLPNEDMPWRQAIYASVTQFLRQGPQFGTAKKDK